MSHCGMRSRSEAQGLGRPMPGDGLCVRDPKTPRNSGWPTVSGQPLRCLNVIESSHGIVGASWIEGISIEIGD